MPKIKLSGERSLESKLHRMAWELAEDAKRVAMDYELYHIQSALNDIASKLMAISRLVEKI